MKLIHTANPSDIAINAAGLPENILVFSHLRWDFVYQRPQHLLSRFGKQFNITFLEEPVFDGADKAFYTFAERDEGVIVVTPHLSDGLSEDDIKYQLRSLFNDYMQNKVLSNYIFWYYTPMALEFTRKYLPPAVVYDCMDELSAFKFAPVRLKALERELLKLSDVVFTGGRSLYEAKKHQHANIHPFPSSIDAQHFHQARAIASARDSQNRDAVKLGFYGVIDERFDIDLITAIAGARPHWQIDLIGPVVKIDEKSLPTNNNINYAGPKSYRELPELIAEWDIALIPFLLNESTRFISPTKTPEYLAAGLPVISTPIKDVVNPYGANKLVHIGANAADFINAAERYMALSAEQRKERLKTADRFLEMNSWDKTCANMLKIIGEAIQHKSRTSMINII